MGRQGGDSEGESFRVVINYQFHHCEFRNGPSFVHGSISVIDRDWNWYIVGEEFVFFHKGFIDGRATAT